jgi:hypothetical protein
VGGRHEGCRHLPADRDPSSRRCRCRCGPRAPRHPRCRRGSRRGGCPAPGSPPAAIGLEPASPICTSPEAMARITSPPPPNCRQLIL